MTDTRFLHVLATRLGIGVYDQAWFDYRLELFRTITVASMAAQTSQDFTWLIVVDANMPPKARATVEQAIAGLTNTEILDVEFKTDFRPTVAAWCTQTARRTATDHVLTSRLDDDDALKTNAFERIHTEAADFLTTSPHQYAVFSLNIGTMWLPAQRRGYTRYHDSHSLGLSLMEPASHVTTVYSKPHRDIKQQFTPRGAHIKGIDGDTRWWLYATHRMADSDTGDGTRYKKIMEHKYGYHLDDNLLETFGLDPQAIDALTHVTEPQAATPIKRLTLRAMDYEREIKTQREKQRSPWPLARRRATKRIRKLEQQRHAAGTGIVSTPPPAAKTPK